MSTPQSGIQRQHELDALRATAMLLGIALHGTLSFAPGFPWFAQDLYRDNAFNWIFWAIHGFRMPLFILISGYFTMMLWRRKGLGALIKQRIYRVLLPMLISMVTLLPLLIVAAIACALFGQWQDKVRLIANAKSTGMVEAIREKNYDELEAKLAAGDNPDQVDGELGIRALCWAAMFQDLPAAQLLVEHGANVNAQDADGFRPLNRAAHAGRPEIVDMLLQHGANPKLPGGGFLETPSKSSKANWTATEAQAKLFKVPLPSEEDLKKGRDACRALLAKYGDPPAESARPEAMVPTEGTKDWSLESIRRQYRVFLDSDPFLVPMPLIGPVSIFKIEIFIHLWFLWYLCWFVAFFAVFVLLFSVVPAPRIPPVLILSPWRWCWLLPLTMLPQLLMGDEIPVFGPDTSASILPKPHVLFYYAIFFFFGALYYDSNDREGRLGQWWRIEIPVALGVLLPLGVFLLDRRLLPSALAGLIATRSESFDRIVISGICQILYVWLMSFGAIGLFRTFMSHETKAIRYASDSAYWFYLVHLIPMVLIQALVRTWPISPWIKFAIVCVSTCLILLVTYEYMVRYTWIGRLLNGPRQRPHAHAATLDTPEKPLESKQI